MNHSMTELTKNRIVSWKNKVTFALIFSGALVYQNAHAQQKQSYKSVSGIYPHLAMYNEEGEAGTGAVMPWAGKLWAITYGPHLPHGSSDKLYEIDANLNQNVRKESIGGTPANRMIHKESKQLFMGPYAISGTGEVRVIPNKEMPGRLTGNARHLTDPANKIFYGTMEEGFYEVDVHTLGVKWLYSDTNLKPSDRRNVPTANLPGYHGKGLFSGQGVLVYSNNGEYGDKALTQFDTPSGSLSEWDGTNWKIIRRNQFVEVTGPGGVEGNANPQTDPVWATGWDHKSILLGVRGEGKWIFFRLPKASRSYDGAHGWNTEWPRIRNVGKEGQNDYIMTMHGMFWSFPGTFTNNTTAGIRPKSAYLKVIGDFTRWNDKLVFGTDDSAQKEFLNKRKAKGNLEGPGQSHSNLWFTDRSTIDHLGPKASEGSVWQQDDVKAGVYSDPMLFAGWNNRSSWMHNHSEKAIVLTAEVDLKGDGKWSKIGEYPLKAGETLHKSFSSKEQGEWIRLKSDKDAQLSVHFTYHDADKRETKADKIFTGISTDGEFSGGLLYSLGQNRRSLGLLAYDYNHKGQKEKVGYYEMDDKFNLVPKSDSKTEQLMETKYSIPQQVVHIESSSALIVDDKGRRWRLPLGDDSYTSLTNEAALRICREVATERDLFNLHGTFYELPAENADGYAKIRPVSSHNLKINDYASYRGMLIMTGLDLEKEKSNSEHIFVSTDKKAAVWAGAIDDLWKLGKPTGHGGPWYKTAVQKGTSSDPYLIGFYDKKSLILSHNEKGTVNITLEVDPGGDGNWMAYKTLSVKNGQTLKFDFPKDFQARWIRFVSDQNCEATAWLDYK